MFARKVITLLKPNSISKFSRLMDEEVIPMLRKQNGRMMDILIGVGGAVAGGFLMRSAGFGGYGGAISTAMVAMIGVALLTVLTAHVNGRRIYARQL